MNELALFFGGGGGILGSYLLGHRIVCGVEIDPYCREIVMRRQEEGHLPAFPIWDDAATFDGFPWRGSVDIVTAGFPCQPWSLAGKRKGVDDKRNLWPCTYRIIQEVRPGIVLLENVPGIRKFLPVVIRDLRRAQYTVERPIIVAAAAVGAGHIRKRVWIFAYDKSQRRGTWGSRGSYSGSEEQTKQALSTDDFGMRQWEQSGRWTGEDRTAAAISADTTQTRLSADSDGMWKQQSEGSVISIGGRVINSTEKISSDNEHAGFPQRESQPGNDAEECQAAQRDDCRRNPWWDREPGLARLVYRPPNRVERIRITGNIQVPAVVRLAWKTLIERINP
jgi:DNA (cytosine-5)-methyltransferase 1